MHDEAGAKRERRDQQRVEDEARYQELLDARDFVRAEDERARRQRADAEAAAAEQAAHERLAAANPLAGTLCVALSASAEEWASHFGAQPTSTIE